GAEPTRGSGAAGGGPVERGRGVKPRGSPAGVHPGWRTDQDALSRRETGHSGSGREDAGTHQTPRTAQGRSGPDAGRRGGAGRDARHHTGRGSEGHHGGRTGAGDGDRGAGTEGDTSAPSAEDEDRSEQGGPVA